MNASIRFLNSSVAAPCALIGWPSALTVGLFTGARAGAVVLPGLSARGWALSTSPHARVRTAASAMDAESNFVMAIPVTSIDVPLLRSRVAPVAQPHDTAAAQFGVRATLHRSKARS